MFEMKKENFVIREQRNFNNFKSNRKCETNQLNKPLSKEKKEISA
jgi:hypothetical protein